MYREFIYLDTDRIQSILAQLNEGVLTELIENRGKNSQVKTSMAANVLAWFLPFGLEGTAGWQTSRQSNKVVHDYAFNLALKSLQENYMVLEVENWNRDEMPLPDNAFVLVRGEAIIIDYKMLRDLTQKEDAINAVAGTSEPEQAQRNQTTVQPAKAKLSIYQQVERFIDAFMGDILLVRLVHASGLQFVGPLARRFLRENIRHLIFKRGSAPQWGWVMLAQVSQITE